MITVLDTNVWISGILWGGAPREIVVLAEKGRIHVALSPHLLNELSGVLARPKFQPQLLSAKTDIDSIRESVISLVKLFEPTQKVSAVAADPADNAVLECALASGAEFIISGDDHLLSLKQFSDIPIITPRVFLNKFQRT
jgi:hypothetical protein